MNVDQLPDPIRSYYDSLRIKPLVDVIDGQVLFTFHFVAQPDFSAVTLHQIYNPQATARAIQHADGIRYVWTGSSARVVKRGQNV